MRNRIESWVRDGAGESDGCNFGELIESWIDTIGTPALASLDDTAGQVDTESSDIINRLVTCARQGDYPVAGLMTIFTQMLEGPAGLPATRIWLLRGVMLGSLAAQEADERAVRRKCHDMSSPLQAAMLNLELMMLDHENNAALHTEMQTIKQSLDALARLLTHS